MGLLRQSLFLVGLLNISQTAGRLLVSLSDLLEVLPSVLNRDYIIAWLSRVVKGVLRKFFKNFFRICLTNSGVYVIL